MLNCLLAEALSEAADNLNMTASILESTRDTAVDLSPEAQQRLNMVHMGLAIAMQAMNHDELCQIMEQSEGYIPAWLSLA
jgi:methylthioribose-1-phosphate isomerase